MIKSYGYKCEEHTYQTEDGYINMLHRIVPKVKPNGKVVFLQHGLLGTAADYVMGNTKASLGFFLSDLGFDVWLGNARGNKYSREHVSLNLDDKEYWEFSFDEMGKYDLPAAFDYVMTVSNKQTISYVGHSMGTTMFWVALNEHPELKTKIDIMIGLGPVAKVKHVLSPIKYLAPWVTEVEYLFDKLGINEFEPSNFIIQMFTRYACDLNMLELKLCENVCFLLTGFDKTQANMVS